MSVFQKALTHGMLCALISGVTFANETNVTTTTSNSNNQYWDNFELLIMTGVASTKQSGHVNPTSDESDKLKQHNTNDWNTWTFQVGLGYDFPLLEECPENTINWLPFITPQLNLYLLNDTSFDGDVYRFGDSANNQATYDMDFSSTRLMFDLGLTLASIRNISFYALAGVGVSWNSANFKLEPDPHVPIRGLRLGKKDSTGFVYEFGAGATYALSECMGISLQYLFTDFDDVKVGGESNGFDVSSSDLNLKTQSILLGLNIAI